MKEKDKQHYLMNDGILSSQFNLNNGAIYN